jgi:hypothetical protein
MSILVSAVLLRIMTAIGSESKQIKGDKSMKHFKRLNLYKANNVTFDPVTNKAFSYKWWQFVATIEGVTIFNGYRYSVSTSRHQSKTMSLMRQLDKPIHMIIECPSGLQAMDWIVSAKIRHEALLSDIGGKLNNPRIQSKTRISLLDESANHLKVLQFLDTLIRGESLADYRS